MQSNETKSISSGEDLCIEGSPGKRVFEPVIMSKPTTTYLGAYLICISLLFMYLLSKQHSYRKPVLKLQSTFFSSCA